MSELARSDTWLYEVLAADTALAMLVDDRIYADEAPPEANYPFVLFGVQSPGPDVLSVGAYRVMSRPLYLVRGVTKGRSWQGESQMISDAIDEALHRGQGVSGDGTIIGCTRSEPFRLAETVDGTEYRHQGGLYRIWVQV